MLTGFTTHTTPSQHMRSLFTTTTIQGEGEYLFVAYSVFTVVKTEVCPRRKVLPQCPYLRMRVVVERYSAKSTFHYGLCPVVFFTETSRALICLPAKVLMYSFMRTRVWMRISVWILVQDFGGAWQLVRGKWSPACSLVLTYRIVQYIIFFIFISLVLYFYW